MQIYRRLHLEPKNRIIADENGIVYKIVRNRKIYDIECCLDNRLIFYRLDIRLVLESAEQILRDCI